MRDLILHLHAMVTKFFQGAKAPGSESLGGGEANTPKTDSVAAVIFWMVVKQHVFKDSSQLESVFGLVFWGLVGLITNRISEFFQPS